IRDFHVTGVQTCALPISNVTLTLCAGLPYLLSGWNVGLRSAIYEPVGWVVLFTVLTALALSRAGRSLKAPDAPRSLAIPTLSLEIGRASCREGGQNSVGG